jgi:hypothetical protein
MITADQLITALGLQPLTLSANALAPRYLGAKAACTAPLIGQAFLSR